MLQVQTRTTAYALFETYLESNFITMTPHRLHRSSDQQIS